MTNQAAADLIARSNRLGADPKNTNYAGGNTSAKGTETDPVTGEPVELLWVKGSGGDLGTLTEQGLAVLRLDRHARARRRLPRRRPRGRDGRRVRLHAARQGRCGAVDRHGHARARRRGARRPPAPRLGHRDRDGRRRRGAHGEDLRRQGRVGAVAPPGLPARPRHRRDQGAEPPGDRLHPRRPRHHRVGRHLRGVRAQLALDHRHRRRIHRRAREGRPVRHGARRLRGARAGRAAGQGGGARGDHPRARLARPADGRPLHGCPRGARLPRPHRALPPRRARHELPRPLPAHEGQADGARPAGRRVDRGLDRAPDGAARGVPRRLPGVLRRARHGGEPRDPRRRPAHRARARRRHVQLRREQADRPCRRRVLRQRDQRDARRGGPLHLLPHLRRREVPHRVLGARGGQAPAHAEAEAARHPHRARHRRGIRHRQGHRHPARRRGRLRRDRRPRPREGAGGRRRDRQLRRRDRRAGECRRMPRRCRPRSTTRCSPSAASTSW